MAFTPTQESQILAMLAAFTNGKTIAALPSATSIDETEIVEMTQGGISKNLTLSLLTVKYNIFQTDGIGIAESANQLILQGAIKSINLIGTWDKSKRYGIRAISRNITTYGWGLAISEIGADGTQTGIVYNSLGEVNAITESSEGVTIVSYPTISDKSVIASIDFNAITNATTIGDTAPTVLFIRIENISAT